VLYLLPALVGAIRAFFRSRVDIALEVCLTAAARGAQTPTPTTATDALRSVLLDHVTPGVAPMIGCSRSRQARNCYWMASGRLPSVLTVAVDHTTVWRWVQAYAPELRKRLQGS
jgi:hypothetical protein